MKSGDGKFVVCDLQLCLPELQSRKPNAPVSSLLGPDASAELTRRPLWRNIVPRDAIVVSRELGDNYLRGLTRYYRARRLKLAGWWRCAHGADCGLLPSHCCYACGGGRPLLIVALSFGLDKPRSPTLPSFLFCSAAKTMGSCGRLFLPVPGEPFPSHSVAVRFVAFPREVSGHWLADRLPPHLFDSNYVRIRTVNPPCRVWLCPEHSARLRHLSKCQHSVPPNNC